MTPRLPPRRRLESQISPKRTIYDFPMLKDTRFFLRLQPNGKIQLRVTPWKRRPESAFAWWRRHYTQWTCIPGELKKWLS